MRLTARFWTTALLAAGLSAACGCAAMRPLDGIPVSELPASLRAPTRSEKVMLDLSLLRQNPPREHIVDADDVLGVYIEGILGGRLQVPPVNLQPNSNSFSSLGYPIRVRADGTISLPGIDPIPVRGMTIGDVEKAVRTAYTTGEKAPLRKGMDRIIVNLQRPRHYRVLVIRQEIGNTNTPSGTDGQLGSNMQHNYSNNNGKFGMGRTVDLPAYKNDVLHALAETGGLPGLDAENVIYVIRRRDERRDGPQPVSIHSVPVRNFDPSPGTDAGTKQRSIIRGQSPDGTSFDFTRYVGHSQPSASRQRSPVGTIRRPAVRPKRKAATAVRVAGYSHVRPVAASKGPIAVPLQQFDATINNPHVIRIPLRVFPGQPPGFTEEDITLQDGDVVLIEARDCDVFYTAGLLGGGRYRLPRDRDLNVLEALAMVQAQRVAVLPTRAIGGVSATNQDVTAGASDLIVLRPYGDGCRQVAIRVNLYDALREPCQRINVRPGDQLVLQYTRKEAIVAFFERHVLDGAVLGISSGLFFNN
jgi:protein involved in polysaccharide export with SLBB domain